MEQFDARLLEYIKKQPGEYADSRKQYYDELEKRNFTYRGKKIPTIFHPYVLDQQNFQTVKQHSEIMAELLFKVYDLFFAHEEIRNLLDFHPELLDWMEVKPGYGMPVPISRYDAYYDPAKNTMMFIEFNADGTSGMNEANNMEEAFLGTPLGDKLAQEFQLYNWELRKTTLRVLIENYHQAGGTKTYPNIAILDWKESASPEEFAGLYKTFTEEGYPVVIADPRDLTYEKGVLLCEDFAIDLVYRRIVTAELVQRRDEAQALLQAYKNNSVVTVGSVRTEIIHNKKIFCLLSDPAYACYFSPGELKFLEEHIPWTRKLDSGDSSLLRRVLANKDSLMLKPHDGYAGRGHVVGQHCTPAEWEEHISNLIDTNYLVQEKVPGPGKIFYTDAGLPGEPMNVNLAGYVFNGKLSGFYTRVAPDVVISTGMGGLEVPTLVSRL